MKLKTLVAKMVWEKPLELNPIEINEIQSVRLSKEDRLFIEKKEKHPPFPRHMHNFDECFIVLRGYAIHEVNGFDSILLPGNFIYIKTGLYHSFKHTNNLDIINISFVFNHWIQNKYYISSLLNEFIQLIDSNNSTMCISYGTLQKIESLVTNIVDESHLNEQDKNFPLMISSLLTQLMILIIREKTISHDVKDVKGVVFSLIKDMTELNNKNTPYQNETININDRIQDLDFSYSTFLRTFSEIVSLTPKKVEIYLKLYKSIHLMTTMTDISEISQLSGFDDHNYYLRIFKKYINETPSKYLKKLKSSIINA